jgi:hypothetical protein
LVKGIRRLIVDTIPATDFTSLFKNDVIAVFYGFLREV